MHNSIINIKTPKFKKNKKRKFQNNMKHSKELKIEINNKRNKKFQKNQIFSFFFDKI
jgi:hypothetical protein